MKTTVAVAIHSIFLSAALLAGDRPTGHTTPEGIACDAIQAYADCDSKAWLKTLVRPIYGEEGDKAYEEFKQEMAGMTDGNKGKEGFVAPRIVKVFKAGDFSMNGPDSMAYALHEITGNKFVDIVIDTGGGQLQNIRYHVMFDKDKKWYFEPRPDLTRLTAMGLNDEPASKEILWEPKQDDGADETAPAPGPKPEGDKKPEPSTDVLPR